MNDQRLPQLLTFLLGSALLIVLGMYAWRAAFHSDEFNVLFHVVKFAEGNVSSPSRPGLLWLLLVPIAWLDDPTLVFRAGRFASWFSVVGTAIAVTALAWPRPHPHEPFATDGTARAGATLPGDPLANWIPAFALLLLLTSGTFATHCIELRTDTFTTPLTLAVLIVLWPPTRNSSKPIIIAALLVAAAGLISQKSVYNAAGLAVAWFAARPTLESGRSQLAARSRDVVIAIVIVIGLIILWYLSLALVSGRGVAMVSTNVEHAQATAFGTDISLKEKAVWLQEAVHRAPLLYLGSLAGLVMCFLRRRQDGRPLASALVGATLLATIWVHRGFFPYYIASIEPLLALPAAWGIGGMLTLLWRGSTLVRLPRSVTTLVCAAVLCSVLAWGIVGIGGGTTTHKKFAWGSWPWLEQAWQVTNVPQLNLLRNIKELVPEPAPYLAGIAVVPTYRELGGYLTRQNRTRQRSKDKHFIRTRMKKEGARFFVRTYMSRSVYLRTAEKRFIYASYLPVSPNLYLHGARVAWDRGQTVGRKTVDLLVEGHYTLQLRSGKGAVKRSIRIDGKGMAEGESRIFSKGKHEVVVGPSGSAGELWLLLGEDVPAPPRHHEDISMFPKDRNKSRSRYQQYDSKNKGYGLLSPPGTERYKKRLKRHRKALVNADKKFRKHVLVRRDSK